MSFTISRSPIAGRAIRSSQRLTVLTFAILDHCEIRQEDADAVKLIYMESLTKKLVRCYEIAQRFQAEFVNEMETYRRRPIRRAFSKEAATLTHNRFGFSTSP
jgi:hypothetical protein